MRDTPSSRPRWATPTLIAIVLVAAAARFWGLRFGLPNLQARPDEADLTAVGVQLLRGHFNPGFFNYPSLYMYVTGSAYTLYCGARIAGGSMTSLSACADSWKQHWEPFFIISRGITATAGTLSVIAIYHLGRRLATSEPQRTIAGLVAAALLSVAFLHARDSHFGVTDVPMTALLLFALVLLCRAEEQPSPSRFALAGFVGGLAASTKYNAALLAVPVIGGQLFALYDGWHGRRPFDWRVLPYGVAAGLGFLLGTPYALIDRAKFLSDTAFEAEHLKRGHDGVAGAIGWQHHLTMTLPNGVGWWMLAAAAAGAIWLVRSRPRSAMLIFSWPLAYYIVAGNGYTVFARYMVPVVPFVCLGAAVLVSALLSQTTAIRIAASTVVVAVCLLPNLVKTVEHDRLLASTDSRVVAAEWIAEHVDPSATLHMTGAVYGRPDLWRRGSPPPYAIWNWDGRRAQFAGQPAAVWPEWIVVQESPLRQYTSMPGEVRAALKDYDLQQSIAGAAGDPSTYDQQDAWYMPLAQLEAVARPGPTLSIYRHRP